MENKKIILPELRDSGLPSHAAALLLLNQGTLIPVNVVWVDGDTKFEKFVCDKSIWPIISGKLYLLCTTVVQI